MQLLPQIFEKVCANSGAGRCGQRRMEWEVRKIQAKCTSLEERLAAQRPQGRARNRGQMAPNADNGGLRPPSPDTREGAGRRSNQHGPTRDAGRDTAPPMGQERDLEAQRLITPAVKGEASKEPVLYHYEDVLNSAKQILIIAGAAFSLSVTL